MAAVTTQFGQLVFRNVILTLSTLIVNSLGTSTIETGSFMFVVRPPGRCVNQHLANGHLVRWDMINYPYQNLPGLSELMAQ